MNICDFCKSSNVKLIHTQIGGIFFQCLDCGLIQQGDSYNECIRTSTFRNEKQEKQHIENYTRYITEFCYDYIIKIIDNKYIFNVMEIGANTDYGYILSNIMNYYFSPCKVEAITLPNYHKSNLVIENSIYKVRYFDFNNEIEKNNNIDFIVMRHTLEHFKNLDMVFKNLHSRLSDNGIIYIEVPSFYWAEMRIKNVFHKGHKFFFTKKMLENICNFFGFEIIKSIEDRYWGNIKIIITKNKNIPTTYMQKFSRDKFVLIKKKIIKTFFYPIVKLLFLFLLFLLNL